MTFNWERINLREHYYPVDHKHLHHLVIVNSNDENTLLENEYKKQTGLEEK
jgi:hypothetical protein